MSDNTSNAMSGKLTAVIVILLIIASVIVIVLKKNSRGPEQSSAVGDLDMHPIYSEYEFVNDEHVVRVGTQPLYFPTGLITEMMQRDNILHEELSKLGKEIRFFPFLKGNDVNHFLKAGKLDAGVGGDMPAISITAECDVIVLALIQHGFTSIVSNNNIQLSRLKGKRIGYAFGSNAHYMLLASLASEGLRESDVKLIPMEVSQMPKELASGRIDAFAAWEPTTTITLRTELESAIIRRNLSTGYLYFAQPFANENRKAVLCIIASEIRALRWMQENEDHILIAARLNQNAGDRLAPNSIHLSEQETLNLAKQDILGLLSDPVISDDLLEENGPLHREFEFLQQLKNRPFTISWDTIRNKFSTKTVYEILEMGEQYRIEEFDYDEGTENVTSKF